MSNRDVPYTWEDHFAESGVLRVYAKYVRLFYEFAELISAIHPHFAWVKGGPTPIPSDLPDEARGEIHMTRSMLPLFFGLLLVSHQSVNSSIEIRKEFAKHLATSLPRIKPEQLSHGVQIASPPIAVDLQEFHGRCYECLVRLHVLNRGINCLFVPRVKNRKTPDLICPDEGVLIECKDTLAELGMQGSDESVFRKVQEVISKAKEQLNEYDPENSFEHMVAIDLPEGLLERIKAKTFVEREKFFVGLFNAPYVDSCGTVRHREPIVEIPYQVLLSDFDLGIYAGVENNNWPREPVWMVPIFGTLDKTTRLGSFVNRFHDGQIG